MLPCSNGNTLYGPAQTRTLISYVASLEFGAKGHGNARIYIFYKLTPTTEFFNDLLYFDLLY